MSEDVGRSAEADGLSPTVEPLSGVSTPEGASIPNAGEKRKSLFWFVTFLIAVSLLGNAIYVAGYYRGRTAGALEMKCAIFGIVDRLADQAPNPSDKYALTKLGCRANATGASK